ncbi:MAG: amidase [Thermomicrobiales bacterium]|nr:amidase [Thermomicrobiales bacterium]
MTSRDLCFLDATELAGRIRRREISAHEVMAAHLDQLARVNPTINAIVSKLDDEACLALADEADRALAAGAEVGPLHGLPIAFKDLDDAVGFPTTFGSPLHVDNYPERDSLLVERLRKGGALGIGKTNVPEFGLGSHTFNPVFGATLNPYDTTKTAGGSSGGAGAALATGMLPIADGSDMGGSLRNPGNFNNVVGFRVSPGLVPTVPAALPWVQMSVKGPMARSVADVALMLTAIAGPDPRAPLSLDVDPASFGRPLDRDFKGVRVAWCPDLGGVPLDPAVRSALESKRRVFEELGCIVEEAAPDFAGAEDVFQKLRAFLLATNNADTFEAEKAQMKPEAVWNIEQGLALSGVDVGKALTNQATIVERVREFMETYEYILCAVNQVPPFDVNIRYPEEIAGVRMPTYITWMQSAYFITISRVPAISVPCSFTDGGLPVGIQIVGRQKSDFSVLQFAHAFEQATQTAKRRPPVVL